MRICMRTHDVLLHTRIYARHTDVLAVKVFSAVAAIWRLHSGSDGGRIPKNVLAAFQWHFK